MADKSMQYNKNEKILARWLCFILIPLNFFGDFILEIAGVPPIVLNGIACIIFFLFNLLASTKIRADKTILLFFIINCFISLEHILLFKNYGNEVKHLMYILIFIVVACSFTLTQDTYYYFKKIILILSVFMIIDALVKSKIVEDLGYRMFNIRNYTILDKTCYTELFPFAIIILFNESLKHRNIKIKILFFSWIIIMMSVLLFLFQSKTGIAAVGIALLGELLVVQNKFKRKILKIMIVACIGLITYILVLSPRVPDYVLALLSFLGFSSSTVNDVYYQTYDFRLEILNNIFLIFKTYPLFGIGYGNYYHYVSSNNMQLLTKGIEDIESAFFALFAEGGLLYFTVTCILWFLLYKKVKKNTNAYPEITGTFICMLVLLLGNDFMNLFYWVWLGLYWRISSYEGDSKNYIQTKKSAYSL